MIDWQLFISIFTIIFVMEFPDKTALATLMMAAQGNPYAIFIGVSGAFLIQSLVAISFGSVIGLLPEKWVHLGSGILFLFFAAQLYFERKKENAVKNQSETAAARDQLDEVIASSPNAATAQLPFSKMIWKSFILIFIAEWGDLTQIATASFAADHHDQIWTVFSAATLSLWSVTAVVILIGHHLKHAISVQKLKTLSMILFAGIGIYFISTWFRP